MTKLKNFYFVQLAKGAGARMMIEKVQLNLLQQIFNYLKNLKSLRKRKQQLRKLQDLFIRKRHLKKWGSMMGLIRKLKDDEARCEQTHNHFLKQNLLSM